MKSSIFLLLSLATLFFSCKPSAELPLNALTEVGFLMEVHTPAGKVNNQAFLPYPGNYGAIQGSKLESLCIAESVGIGETVEVRPLGVLLLQEKGEARPIIITIPVDSSLQIISSNGFQEFMIENNGMKLVLQDWFLNEKGLGKSHLIGWRDERFAWNLVRNSYER